MNSEVTKKRRILILEDDNNVTTLLSSILRRHNYEVSFKTTIIAGREDLEKSNFAYDLILLDYHLPDGKGDIFLHWINEHRPALPTILISADNTNTVVVKCFKAGALDFIVKPFDIKNVLNIIAKVLNHDYNKSINNDIDAECYTEGWTELSARSEIDYLDRIQNLCITLLGNHFSEDTVNDIRLAMEEYGRNAIEWGNNFDKNKIFKISYCIFSDRIVLKFEDEGDGFDLKSLPDPSQDPAKHLKSRLEAGKRPGGYGIFMMKKIMDEVIYNDKGNVCIMTKYTAK